MGWAFCSELIWTGLGRGGVQRGEIDIVAEESALTQFIHRALWQDRYHWDTGVVAPFLVVVEGQFSKSHPGTESLDATNGI